MSKLYNTQADITSKIEKFLLKVNPNIRKTQLNIIPSIIFGMICSESVVSSDISKNLKDDFSLVKHDSVIKRIRRLFKNKYFYPYSFYDNIIKHVISTYKKKHKDKRIHIIFDHMFSHDNYTVFMISMRIGKQGIPLWFHCFKDKYGNEAFNEVIIKKEISYVSNLFDDSFDLIFLADRYFDSVSLMKYIDSLGHTFCIREKRNRKVLAFDNKENHYIWKTIGNLKAYQYHSNWYYNIYLTKSKYKVNVAISKKDGTDDTWIIITNKEPKQAIKDYGYRFGAVECIFKNQKSNGFYLEKTVNASLKYFESMYSLACFCTLFLTIIGADYTKNSKCYKNTKITTHTMINGVKTRILSLFNVGLTLFKRAYNSLIYIRIPFNFILYDI